MLVTHGVGFLPQCNLVLSLREGSVTEMGTYGQLMDNNGDFAEFIRVYSKTEAEESNEDSDSGMLPLIYLQAFNILDLLCLQCTVPWLVAGVPAYLEFSSDFDVRAASSADEMTIDGHRAFRMKTRQNERCVHARVPHMLSAPSDVASCMCAGHATHHCHVVSKRREALQVIS